MDNHHFEYVQTCELFGCYSAGCGETHFFTLFSKIDLTPNFIRVQRFPRTSNTRHRSKANCNLDRPAAIRFSFCSAALSSTAKNQSHIRFHRGSSISARRQGMQENQFESLPSESNTMSKMLRTRFLNNAKMNITSYLKGVH